MKREYKCRTTYDTNYFRELYDTNIALSITSCLFMNRIIILVPNYESLSVKLKRTGRWDLKKVIYDNKNKFVLFCLLSL